MSEPFLSAKTRAEMAAGAKNVKAAVHWAFAMEIEGSMHRTMDRLFPSSRGWTFETAHSADMAKIIFRIRIAGDPEPIELDIDDPKDFPSPTLMAQLMLILE